MLLKLRSADGVTVIDKKLSTDRHTLEVMYIINELAALYSSYGSRAIIYRI